MYKIRIILLAACLMFTGCSSSPIEQGKAVPGNAVPKTENTTEENSDNSIETTSENINGESNSDNINGENNIVSDRINIETPESAHIDAKAVLQLPELPTGCEVTSLTALLNFYDFDILKTEIADKYLIKGTPGKCTFNDAFVGEPTDPTAWGCYAPVIYKTANKFLSDMNSKLKAYEITGSDIEVLYGLISQGYPVITWVSINLVEPYQKYYWSLPDGTHVNWTVNEHCVLLTGYDKKEAKIMVADPLKGNIKYDMKLFETRYGQVGKQAVYIA